MFTYLHCYMDETWDAQIKAGLIRKNDGIRFPQSIDLASHRKFNKLASKGGTLYNIVKELKCPFYIDRLQGGCFFEGYDYDFELLDTYREMLGDRFWGFQMHEWMSNAVSDISKLVNNGCPEPWTEEGITRTLLKAYPYEHVFTEAMSPAEMAKVGHLRDIESYNSEMRSLFSRRQEYTHGDLLPCDSAYLALQLEISLGAKRIMPEVGAQTRDTRIQVAYARGMAKAYSLSFGTYYEPWGGSPFSTCNYQRDGLNEWNIKNESFPFSSAGGNGGSSRSLQERIHIYSYIAGASFISEEWGMCNTFYDWNDFALTPYGNVKKDFIRFTEKYPDVGEPITPIAVVLPEDMPALDSVFTEDGIYMSFPVHGAFADKLKLLREKIRLLFSASSPMAGTETTSMVNCIVPDALDIVNADARGLSRYSYLVDLTGDTRFASSHENCIPAEKVCEYLEKLLPCKVEGGLHHMLNRSDKGLYYLTVFNNSGVERSVENGERFLKEADKHVFVTLKENRTLTMLEGNSSIHYENGKYIIEVPAGGWFFGSF